MVILVKGKPQNHLQSPEASNPGGGAGALKNPIFSTMGVPGKPPSFIMIFIHHQHVATLSRYPKTSDFWKNDVQELKP